MNKTESKTVRLYAINQHEPKGQRLIVVEATEGPKTYTFESWGVRNRVDKGTMYLRRYWYLSEAEAWKGYRAYLRDEIESARSTIEKNEQLLREADEEAPQA